MKSRYWIQSDGWDDGWADEFGFPDEVAALDYYRGIIADPIWLDRGKRRWRVVERTDKVIWPIGGTND